MRRAGRGFLQLDTTMPGKAPKPIGPNEVACPKCGRRQKRQGSDTMYWCGNCQGMHDADSEEGGDYSDRDPSARLERQERHQQRRR